MTESIDPFSADAVLDPYSFLTALRTNDPVHWHEAYEIWVVTRYDDLVWVNAHPELFSSEVFARDPRPPYPPVDEADLGLYAFVREFISAQLAEHDPPKHQVMRRVVQSRFTPKGVESWRPLIKQTINELLDGAIANGRMDFKSAFATPLPVEIITQLMGVPRTDRGIIREHVTKMLLSSQGEANRLRTQTDGMRGMIDYLNPLIEDRLRHPGRDDLLSMIAEGEASGVLTRHEVLVNCSLLLVAGHETTINLLCNGMLAFMQHRGEWDRLVSAPLEWSKKATEEALRYDAPVKSLQRIATQDVELRGRTIKKSDRIRAFISSANRDPEVFARPDVFDISRDPNPHVAFGSGIHHCLGATLSRLEGQEAFAALASRLPGLRLVPEQELSYRPSISHRSLASLQVTW